MALTADRIAIPNGPPAGGDQDMKSVLWDIPEADGTIGQVISTNGAGVATWQDPQPLLRTKLVVVEVLADLPAPSGGVHLLAADTAYLFNSDITSANSLEYSAGSSVFRDDLKIGGGSFTYTGVGAVIVSNGNSVVLNTIEINATSGSLFSITNATSVQIDRIVANVLDIGSISLAGIFQLINMSNFNIFGFTTGLTITATGANSVVFERGGMDVTGAAAIDIIDLNTSTMEVFRAENVRFGMNDAAQVAINSGISGANVTDSGFITGCNFVTGIPTSGFDQSTQSWLSRDNTNLPDSRTRGIASVSGNADATTIALADTYQAMDVSVLIAGSGMERFTLTDSTTGELTYNGMRPLSASVFCSMIMTKSGGAKSYEFILAKNGSTEGQSYGPLEVTTADRTAFPVFQVDVEENDTVEVYVREIGDTDSFTVSYFFILIA